MLFCSDKSNFKILQVWALAVGKKTEMVATGGGDAVINIWHDSTASDKEDEFRKEVCQILIVSGFQGAVMCPSDL